MILLADSQATLPCLVTAISSNGDVSITPYDAGGSTNTINAAAGITWSAGADALRVLVYGSEFKKGDNYNGSDTRGANEPSFKTFTNKPIIMKDYYEISGSDASAIGWVEISGEDGQSGYLWYLKAEGDTRSRFTD